jgi:ABC-type multidrug transport system fused ATPase/permease subunit
MINKKRKILNVVSLLLINVILLIIFVFIYLLTKNPFFLIVYFYLAILINLLMFLFEKEKNEEIKKARIFDAINIFSVIDLRNNHIFSYLKKLEILSKKTIDDDLINFFEKVEADNNIDYYYELGRKFDCIALDSILINVYLYKEKDNQILLDQNKKIFGKTTKTFVQSGVEKDNNLLVFIGIIFTLIFVLVLIYGGSML